MQRVEVGVFTLLAQLVVLVDVLDNLELADILRLIRTKKEWLVQDTACLTRPLVRQETAIVSDANDLVCLDLNFVEFLFLNHVMLLGFDHLELTLQRLLLRILEIAVNMRMKPRQMRGVILNERLPLALDVNLKLQNGVLPLFAITLNTYDVSGLAVDVDD